MNLVCNFFRDLKLLVTMLPLAPLLSFPEGEDPLASVLSSLHHSNPFKVLLSPHHVVVPRTWLVTGRVRMSAT